MVRATRSLLLLPFHIALFDYHQHHHHHRCLYLPFDMVLFNTPVNEIVVATNQSIFKKANHLKDLPKSLEQKWKVRKIFFSK